MFSDFEGWRAGVSWRALEYVTFCVVLALCFARPALADSIGGPGDQLCATCQGSTYTLSYDPTPVSTTATTETFRITYSIDTSSYTDSGTFIDAVAMKVAPTSDTVSGSLVSAPGGVENWDFFFGTLNASGCSELDVNNFACADDNVSGTGGHAPVGGLLVWVFDVEVNIGSLFTDPGEASIKARYVDDAGNKVGDLVSENITLQVPEHSSLTLLTIVFLGGILGAFGFNRNRSRWCPNPE